MEDILLCHNDLFPNWLNDRLGGDPVFFVVFQLKLSTPFNLSDCLLDRAGDCISIKDYLPGDIAGGAAHRLDEGGFGAQEPLPIGIQNRHQGDLWQVQPLPKKIDSD